MRGQRGAAGGPERGPTGILGTGKQRGGSPNPGNTTSAASLRAKLANLQAARKVKRDPAWKQERASREKLRRNLGIQPGSGLDAHHIVAGELPRAGPARKILDEYQIPMNSPENGALLRGGKGDPEAMDPTSHRGRGLHGYAGVDAVNDRLESAAKVPGDWATRRQSVIEALADLGKKIEKGSFP